jgi:hypothetical protein
MEWLLPEIAAALCLSLVARPAVAQTKADPFIYDRCITSADLIFLGQTDHDIEMRNDYVEQCRTETLETTLRAKRRAVEGEGESAPPAGEDPAPP